MDLSTAEGRQRWAQANPKVACEVLIGHGECNIQVETCELISAEDIGAIVSRIAGDGIETRALIVPNWSVTTSVPVRWWNWSSWHRITASSTA